MIPKYACGFCANITDCLLNLPESTQVIRWDRVNQRFAIKDHYIFLQEIGWVPSTPTLALDDAALRGTNFVFEFPSANGLSYTVQGSPNPGTDGWRTILTDTTTTSGAYIRVTVPMDGMSAYYRLHALRLVNPVRTGM